jgi:hypothetical protein
VVGGKKPQANLMMAGEAEVGGDDGVTHQWEIIACPDSGDIVSYLLSENHPSWHKNNVTSTKEWKTPHRYSHLVSNKMPKTGIGDKAASSPNGVGKTGPLSLTLYKKNPNCIKYLNGRHETLKL